MSYLANYATRVRAAVRSCRRPSRVDEEILLNFPDFDGGAHVRVFVEDTTARRVRGSDIPSPKLRLRIADCATAIHLEFNVEWAEARANSLHKIDTLIGALERFREGLAAEAALYAERERARELEPARS